MAKKLTYTNRKGTPYYFSEKSGKRGTQIVCAQKESAADLSKIPGTHEIVENPNGQVSCRKKLVSAILPEEISLAKEQCLKLVKKGIRVEVEIKKKTIIIHSADTSEINELAKMILQLSPGNTEIHEAIMENNLRFEPVLKLELFEKKGRTFSAYRMCWVGGDIDWMLLDDAPLPDLLKKYVPHIEQESFYELL